MPVRTALALLAVFSVLGCNRSPVAPTPTPAPSASRSLSGSWVGTYSITCPNSPTCGQIAGGPPPSPQQFSLLLTEDGGALSGQINLFFLGRTADVRGTIAADGTMSIQGGMSWPAGGFCLPAGEWRLTGWNARYDSRTDSITGSFSYVTQKHRSSCYYMPDLAVEATSMSLRRGTLASPDFAGHWRGTVVRTGCSSTRAGSECAFSSPESIFDLNLQQNGTAVEGTLRLAAEFQLAGTSDGTTLRLAATNLTPASGGSRSVRITDWSTRRDTLGRMVGTYRIVDEFHWTSRPDAGETLATTTEWELRSVVRVPW